MGVQPSGSVITAPFSGVVTQVADTGHAIGITSADGMELLIHVGIDTVAMNGDGFPPYVNEGAKVKKGQLLLKFDRSKIKAAGHPETVVVLLTNSDDYEDVKFGKDA